MARISNSAIISRGAAISINGLRLAHLVGLGFLALDLQSVQSLRLNLSEYEKKIGSVRMDGTFKSVDDMLKKYAKETAKKAVQNKADHNTTKDLANQVEVEFNQVEPQAQRGSSTTEIVKGSRFSETTDVNVQSLDQFAEKLQLFKKDALTSYKLDDLKKSKFPDVLRVAGNGEVETVRTAIDTFFTSSTKRDDDSLNTRARFWKDLREIEVVHDALVPVLEDLLTKLQLQLADEVKDEIMFSFTHMNDQALDRNAENRRSVASKYHYDTKDNDARIFAVYTDDDDNNSSPEDRKTSYYQYNEQNNRMERAFACSGTMLIHRSLTHEDRGKVEKCDKPNLHAAPDYTSGQLQNRTTIDIYFRNITNIAIQEEVIKRIRDFTVKPAQSAAAWV